MSVALLLTLLALQTQNNDAVLIVRRNESARASLAPSASLAERARQHDAALTWNAVTRPRGSTGDVIELAEDGGKKKKPTDEYCQRLFEGGARRQSDGTCVCPAGAPLFRHDVGKCVAQVDNCANPIMFRNAAVRQPPILSIGVPPPAADLALFEDVLAALWKESTVKVRTGVGPRCVLASARQLDSAAEWHPLNVASLLRLGWTTAGGGQATIFWRNTSENATKITAGAILVVDLNCEIAPTSISTHCMTLRVEGRLSNPKVQAVTIPEDDQEGGIRENLRATSSEQLLDNLKASNDTITPTVLAPITISPPPQGRLETMLIIFLIILLFLSVIGSAILWRICWRIKKSELISTLQMQFLYHIKQEKEKAACTTAANAHSRYHANINAAASGGGALEAAHRNFSNAAYGSRDGDEEFDTTIVPIFGDQPTVSSNGTVGAAIVKRKLYFSAEFFDPFFMANPPPMAEQFLHDLRRMIVIAKQRIAQRRHVPQLAVIREEETEIIVAAPKPLKRPHLLPYDGRDDRRPPLSPDASPRSAKSADSGRESLSGDASLSSSGSEETDGTPSSSPLGARGLKPPPPPPLTAGISPMKPHHFLPSNGAAMATHRQNPCFRPPTGTQIGGSRIPVSKSPRLQTRPFLTAATTIDDGDGESDSYYHKVAAARPPPTLPPPPPPPPMRQLLFQPAAARRNTYAVFPSDSMLKKSLPRRSKKSSGGAVAGALPPNRRTLVETRI